MFDYPDQDLMPQERAALVAWMLARGWALTGYMVQSLTGLSESGAWYLMENLCATLPIHRRELWWETNGGVMRKPENRQQRAAYLSWRLAQGETFKSSEAATLIGTQRYGAYRILAYCIAHVRPIWQRGDGIWEAIN